MEKYRVYCNVKSNGGSSYGDDIFFDVDASAIPPQILSQVTAMGTLPEVNAWAEKWVIDNNYKFKDGQSFESYNKIKAHQFLPNNGEVPRDIAKPLQEKEPAKNSKPSNIDEAKKAEQSKDNDNQKKKTSFWRPVWQIPFKLIYQIIRKLFRLW